MPSGVKKGRGHALRCQKESRACSLRSENRGHTLKGQKVEGMAAKVKMFRTRFLRSRKARWHALDCHRVERMPSKTYINDKGAPRGIEGCGHAHQGHKPDRALLTCPLSELIGFDAFGDKASTSVCGGLRWVLLAQKTRSRRHPSVQGQLTDATCALQGRLVRAGLPTYRVATCAVS